MSLHVEKVSRVIGWWVVIISAVAGAWVTMNSYYATRLVVERYELRRINHDIDSNEKLRDYYQNMIDNGKELTPEEARRLRVTNGVLNDLYDEKKYTKELVRELEQ